MNGTFCEQAKCGDVVCVHGWAYSKVLNASIKHAWLEFDSGYVWEPVAQIILSPEQQEFFKMRPVKRYTYEELLKLSIKTGYVGGKFEF